MIIMSTWNCKLVCVLFFWDTKVTHNPELIQPIPCIIVPYISDVFPTRFLLSIAWNLIFASIVFTRTVLVYSSVAQNQRKRQDFWIPRSEANFMMFSSEHHSFRFHRRARQSNHIKKTSTAKHAACTKARAVSFILCEAYTTTSSEYWRIPHLAGMNLSTLDPRRLYRNGLSTDLCGKPLYPVRKFNTIYIEHQFLLLQ
jgi:hypothetical protein